MKIVILNSRERFRKEDLEKLDNRGTVFYENKNNKLEDIKELKATDPVVLVVQPSYIEGTWNGLPLEKLRKYPSIKAICLSTTAFGWVPFKELKELGVIVTNVPGKSTDAVGEYYVFIMVALLRKLPLIIKKDWDSSNIPERLGTNASGLKVGIVGLGKIGSKIADLCSGYGMDVWYWNRSKKHSRYKAVSLEELFKTCDVVFFTITSDENTKGLISNSLIDSMKITAIILSPIDSKLFDKKYILDKVAKGELGGFGFESSEEKIGDFKGNVFAAPEVGYYTYQTLDNESRIMTDSIISILDGKPVNAVNL